MWIHSTNQCNIHSKTFILQLIVQQYRSMLQKLTTQPEKLKKDSEPYIINPI